MSRDAHSKLNDIDKLHVMCHNGTILFISQVQQKLLMIAIATPESSLGVHHCIQLTISHYFNYMHNTGYISYV